MTEVGGDAGGGAVGQIVITGGIDLQRNLRGGGDLLERFGQLDFLQGEIEGLIEFSLEFDFGAGFVNGRDGGCWNGGGSIGVEDRGKEEDRGDGCEATMSNRCSQVVRIVLHEGSRNE